jgi:hypothetical protein
MKGFQGIALTRVYSSFLKTMFSKRICPQFSGFASYENRQREALIFSVPIDFLGWCQRGASMHRICAFFAHGFAISSVFIGLNEQTAWV